MLVSLLTVSQKYDACYLISLLHHNIKTLLILSELNNEDTFKYIYIFLNGHVVLRKGSSYVCCDLYYLFFFVLIVIFTLDKKGDQLNTINMNTEQRFVCVCVRGVRSVTTGRPRM